MAVELKIPAVGESVTEVELGEWLKDVGDRVRQDEPVAMIETDKVTVEVSAPVNGTISEIRVRKGASASVGDVIGLIEPGEQPAVPEGAAEQRPGAEPGSDASSSRSDADVGAGETPRAAQATRDAAAPDAATQPQPRRAPQAGSGTPTQHGRAAPADSGTSTGDARESSGAESRVMPAAKRVLHETGVAVSEVTGTGPGGRILKEDVHAAAEGRAGGAPPAGDDKGPAGPSAVGPAPSKDDAGPQVNAREEEVLPMSPFRRRIAERLVAAQQTAALLTTFNEVDMSAVMELRKVHQEQFQKKYGVKLGFMSFFVKAAVEALKESPAVNAMIRGNDVVYRNYYDIGVAVGGGKGLVVPVIRSAERLGFAEVEQTIADFAARAKRNDLRLDELQGGTFTISNGGVYGSLLSTPIVNPPQSGILGLHAIQERPVALEGSVVIRPMMYVALTYDHRLVDGREAVTFLGRIKDCVERPTRILLEI